MAGFSGSMRQAARELRLRGRVKYLTGAEYALGPEDFVSVRISEGVDTGVMPGAVISAECVMVMNDAGGQWQPGGAKRGYAALAGAEITIEIGVKADGAWLYAPMGVYICEEATVEVNSATVELNCHDTIYFRTGGKFEDTLAYPCALKQVFLAAAEQAGYVYDGALPDEGLTVDAAPDWNGASVRSVMGYVAQIMGCCVLVDRWGFLDMRPLAGERTAFAIYPAECLARTVQEGHFGPVNALRVTTVNALGDGDSQQAELEFSMNDGAAEYAVEVSANPLFITGGSNVNALGRAMLDSVAGLEYSKCTFRWRGDPDLMPGRYLKLVDQDGGETFCTISRQTLTFSGGFSAECICGAPGEGDISGGAMGWNGSVSAGSIVGVISPGNIGAESITAAKLVAGAVTAEKIAAGAVKTEKLDAGAVTTEKISAGAVVADKIGAGSVTSDKLAAGSVTAEKIAAGAVDADRLAAGSVTAEKIASKTITAEQLKAELITADSGLIAVGAIQNAQIADGSITSAKIVELSADVIKSGTLMTDRLLLVGEGGVVYEINAASGGLSETELTDEKYQNYINGTVIVAKSITAAQIAAGTITANEIATNAITAAKINVSDLFAAEATINAINAMDITGNSYLRLMVTDAVDGVQVGGRNYILGTSEEYTAVGDGTRKWYYPWPCASAAVANGLFGQTVTISFDYEAQITSGYINIMINALWQGVKTFDATESGHFSTTIDLGSATMDSVDFIYMDGTFTGSVTISRMKVELGNRATDWTPAPEDPACGVKTSYIEIADDRIDVSSGGNVNIQAGGSLNVNSGSFDVVTGDFQMSLAKAEGTDVVMDIDDDGHTTFKAIHAGNVREAEYGYAYFTTATMGSLAAMAEYLSRTDARIAEYSMSGDEYGYVSFDRYNGTLIITGNGHRLPEIATETGFTGTLRIKDAYLSQSSSSAFCARALAGRLFLENCWFAGGTTRGLQAAYAGELRWYRSGSEGLQGFTMSPFIQVYAGGVAYYYGAIPGGGVWENGGWVHASQTVTVVSGDGGSGSAVSTTSVAGALGYYGSGNGWHADECFQGYTNAKGRAYGCLSFDLSGVGTIVSAKLTLHRKSGVGLNRKANVTVYGTTAGRGSNPANGLTGAYASGTELISWSGSATLDVTAAAQALKAGSIAQLVLYTGETGVYSGKVYSYHYAQFDSASLEVVYTE